MPHTTPIEIGSDHDWDDVSVGSGMACGLRTGGRLYCWGSPDHGAPPTSNPLGPNVLLQPTLIEGTWTAIASHWYATMAIRDDGSLWATTNDGKFVHLDEVEGSAARVSVGPLYSLMVNVGGGLSRIKIIFGDEDDAIQEPETSGVVFGGAVATAYGSCAISADGSMYCGDEHSEDPPHLAPLGDDHHDWMTVGVGTGFACGSRKDGSIWCWGTLSSQPGGPKADYGALPQRVE